MSILARASSAFITIGLTVLATAASGASPELKVLTPRSIWTVLNEIGPQFERNTGHKLNVVPC
jgi:ABC-type molybdate transport system substrate-binding protein